MFYFNYLNIYLKNYKYFIILNFSTKYTISNSILLKSTVLWWSLKLGNYRYQCRLAPSDAQISSHRVKVQVQKTQTHIRPFLGNITCPSRESPMSQSQRRKVNNVAITCSSPLSFNLQTNPSIMDKSRMFYSLLCVS